MIYAVEAFTEDIVYTAGDVVPISLIIAQNGVAFSMAGMQLDIDIKDGSGTVLFSLSSAGGSPKIVISTSTMTILPDAYTIVGRYKYDIQLTNGSYIMTIGRGNWIIRQQETT
jgi:hypothetical protein